MIATILLYAGLALALTAAPAQEAAAAQLSDGEAAGLVEPAAGNPAQATAVDAPGQRSGLPPRAAPPRTMEAHWPVFLFFALTWVGIMGYLMVTGRRVGRFAERLREMEVRR